jgi:chromosome partitioning protein
MRILGIVKRKGGVGATTLAVHLAVESERRGAAACIVDLDPQRSASVWADARQQLTPPVAGVDVGQLGTVLDAAREDGVALAILDSPPALDRVSASIARAADLLLIPVQPSALDIAATAPAVELARAVDVRAVLVLSRCPSRSRDVEEARAALTAYELPIYPGVVSDRTAFRRSITAGEAVSESEPHGKAAAEIKELMDYLVDLLTPSQHTRPPRAVARRYRP